MRDYRLSLADIFAAMVQARAFIEGMDIETFVADEKTVSAVIRQLEIIGEATKNVPMAIRQKYPESPGGIWLECETGSSMSTLEPMLLRA